MGELTDLIAGVPVSDLHASTEWYRRFFGREPDLVAGDEILWDVRPGATLFIEPNPAAAGSGHIRASRRRTVAAVVIGMS